MIWQAKKVEDCLEKIPRLGSVFSSKTLKEGKFPIIDQGQAFIAGYTNDKSLVFSDCLPVVIFGDHTRVLKFIDFPFAVGADGTKILRPIKDFDPRFFYYMLLSLDLGSRGYARHFKLLKESEIPLPPLSEQRKIVKMLDEKMGKITEMKKLREASLVDTEKILSQTLHEIFEEGKRKGWKEKRFDDETILKMTSGGTPNRGNKSFYNGNILWLKSGELQDNMDIRESEEKISEEAIKKSSAKIFPKGTVLFAMYGATAGKIGILGVEASTNQAVAGMIPVSDKLEKKFLYYFLMKKREEIVSKAWGGAQPNLSQTILKTFSIPLPSPAEQQKIVKCLDALSEKIRQAAELQKLQLEDLKKLEKSYLREAFLC